MVGRFDSNKEFPVQSFNKSLDQCRMAMLSAVFDGTSFEASLQKEIEEIVEKIYRDSDGAYVFRYDEEEKDKFLFHVVQAIYQWAAKPDNPITQIKISVVRCLSMTSFGSTWRVSIIFRTYQNPYDNFRCDVELKGML